MDIHALIVIIVVIRMITVYREHRILRNQLDALLLQLGVCGRLVIRSERKHTSGNRVHDVFTGCFHDDISSKVCRQTSALVEDVLEFVQLALCRLLTEKQKIRSFFKSEFILTQFLDESLDVVSAIPQFTRAGYLLSIGSGSKGNDLRYSRKACQNALTVNVTKTTVYTVLFKKCIIDCIILHADRLLFRRKISDFFHVHISISSHPFDYVFSLLEKAQKV